MSRGLRILGALAAIAGAFLLFGGFAVFLSDSTATQATATTATSGACLLLVGIMAFVTGRIFG
jgi:hypothetical protein